MVKNKESTFEKLIQKMKDEDEEIWIEAIHDLSELGDKRAIIPLYELFFREQKNDYESDVENEQDSAINWVLWDSPKPLVREETADELVKGLESRIGGILIFVEV